MIPDPTTAKNLISILYDYALAANKEGAASAYSEAIADAWADFIGGTGTGIIGDIPQLVGSTGTELGCMAIIAEYCQNVNNYFLKPLAGLPLVDLVLRCGTRDLINLWSMYSGLRMSVLPDDFYSFTISTHPTKAVFGLSDTTFPLPPGGVEFYDFQISFTTNNPKHYVQRMYLDWVVGGSPWIEDEYFTIPEAGGEQTGAWSINTVPIAASYVRLSVENDEWSKSWLNG